MSAVLEPPISSAHDPVEQRLVLYSVDWDEYQRIADAFSRPTAASRFRS